MKTLALASALLAFPLVSTAQEHPTDPKWTAWLGCWELVIENARAGSVRPSPSRRTLPRSSSATPPQICVEPSGNGVTMTTQVANRAAIEQTIVADQRLKGSCPSLFAYDGRGMRFVKDCAETLLAFAEH